MSRLHSRHRLNLFIERDHARRLEELSAKKGVSKSSIVAAAWLPGYHRMRRISVKQQ